MEDTYISLADAKARFSEITRLAADGERVIITKRGKPVVELSRAVVPRKPVERQRLQKLTDSLPGQTEAASEFIQRFRDDTRY